MKRKTLDIIIVTLMILAAAVAAISTFCMTELIAPWIAGCFAASSGLAFLLAFIIHSGRERLERELEARAQEVKELQKHYDDVKVEYRKVESDYVKLENVAREKTQKLEETEAILDTYKKAIAEHGLALAETKPQKKTKLRPETIAEVKETVNKVKKGTKKKAQ